MTKKDLISKDKEIINLGEKKISYSIYGKKSGRPVLFCHGMNGTRVQASRFLETAYELGLMIITPDRPGYGESTPVENRDYMQWAEDMAQFLEFLKIEKTGILGLSAGANYALACVYKNPGRYSKSVVVSPTSGAFKHRGGAEKRLADLILAHPSLVDLYMKFVYKNNSSGKEIKVNIQKLGLSETDWNLFNELDIPTLLDMSEKEAFTNGPEAPASDVIRMLKDIDFDSLSIKKQISFWYGARDRIVPLEILASIEKIVPKYKIIIKSDAGHLLIFQHMEEILSEFA